MESREQTAGIHPNEGEDTEDLRDAALRVEDFRVDDFRVDDF
jgi:hypothetical protein